MHGATGLVEVDGLGFRTYGGDTDAPTVEAPSGARITLRPWTLAAHLAACEAALRIEHGRVRFDPHSFAAAVLHHCGADPELVAELAPAALWWAAGADQPPLAPPDADGWLPLSRGRVRLQPWSWADRCRAVDASRVGDHEPTAPEPTSRPSGPAFRLTPYLAAMLRATVVQTDGVDPDQLVGADAQHLLAAVIAINDPRGPLEATLASISPELASKLAADTVRLCRALGWTPSQVWSMPAAEAQRLIALLDRIEPAAAPPPPPRPRPVQAPSSRLAAYPDAVVIRVEDD